jgi:DNA topoisomerase I
MSTKLVIVESPAKAKTINKYLGSDYEVVASYGHIRDLIPKKGAVDPDNNFEMKYDIIERNKSHLADIIKALKNKDTLLLATDPDREGEAISWHLHEILKEKNALKNIEVKRVAFYEITKKAILKAIDNSREIAIDLVDAQQARRALDYLVGFNLSPLLWKKIRQGLSAGRVQSPALRLIVEREIEIDAFKTQEYWHLESHLNKENKNFIAKLTHYNNDKLSQFSITNEKQAYETHDELNKCANANGKALIVEKVDKKERKRHPSPPFITSTLQQEAARKLGFSAKRTMMCAQQLYEGVDIGEGTVGLITYMRTDSINLSQDAIKDIRSYIQKSYGPQEIPESPRVFKTKSKNAQEAHEAIRPTDIFNDPKKIKQHLSPDQAKLYELIYKRTIASQMIHATLDTVAVDLSCGPGNMFRANGSTIKNPGFMAVYLEGKDDNPNKKNATTDDTEDDSSDNSSNNKKEKILPELNVGEHIPLDKIICEQHFTEPPPRFSEASLIKTLEEHGIGRPSTYAAIISTLQNREYATIEQKRFYPTDIGRLVNKFLTEYFGKYVDYAFTANLEDELDAISRGEKQWVPVLDNFWKPFIALIEKNEAEVSREDVNKPIMLGEDDKGNTISARLGRYGPYVQIGEKDDEENPPKYASLRKGQSIHDITIEEAIELFKLPRALGDMPSGDAISASIGRFGPYVKYGAKSFVSIKKDSGLDPHTITLEEAMVLIEEKIKFDAAKLILDFPEAKIQVLNGRYGPYITDGKKNAKMPKDTEPKSLTLEQCQKLIEEAPAKGARRRGGVKAKTGGAKKKPAAKK